MQQETRKGSRRFSARLSRTVIFLLIAALLTGCQSGTKSQDTGVSIAVESGGPAAAETARVKSAAAAAEPVYIKTQRELHVASPTAMTGNFFSEAFGNNSADTDVRTLIHGYNLINWDQSQGVFIVDPSVVYKYEVEISANGDKTYKFRLWDNLYYSNGSDITAWDYAFSYLLMMSPEIEQIGGKIYRTEHIRGNGDFLSGNSRVLKGVRVTGDYELSVTLDHSFLPYFYEEGLLLCVPYPISVIAPGCRVYDDGEGVYIGDADDASKNTQFTPELLKETLLDPANGYLSHPSLTSGPYILTAYDGTACSFVLNPHFKGVYATGAMTYGLGSEQIVRVYGGNGKRLELVKPYIERITFRAADSDKLLSAFESGELDIANKITYGPAIDQLSDSGVVDAQSYPREGLSYVTFSCDWPTVHEAAVRQAIAWCMDRDALTKAYCGDYGVRVDGYYGREQWTYLMLSGKLDYPVELVKVGRRIPPTAVSFRNRYANSQNELERMTEAWKALRLDDLTVYTVDTEKANALLDQAGWTLNRAGEAWQAGSDDVRCKEIDGKLVALDLKLMYPKGNHIADTLQENFIDNLKACGIQLTLVPTPMPELLRSYYRETERSTDMIYLATNFNTDVDPSITFSADPSPNHQMWNNTYSDDEQLYKLAVDMRKTEPGDYFGYASKWLAFQKRYNEVLPAIPIYSNTYYDFTAPELENYDVTSHVSWAQAVITAYLTEADNTD